LCEHLKARISYYEKKEDERLCAVCMVNERTMAMVPCGHTFCGECIAGMMAVECPTCRMSNVQPIRIYGV